MKAIATLPVPEVASALLAEIAAKEANDVAEGIDCRENRKTLRECIRWWSCEYAKLALSRSALEDQNVMLRAALKMAHEWGMNGTKGYDARTATLAGELASSLLANSR